MTLCGAGNSCGCSVVQAPATAGGTVSGQFPTINVTGGGGVDSPWEASLNPNWVNTITNAIRSSPATSYLSVPPESWRRVSFLNGWADYTDTNGAGWARGCYRKIGDIVYLRGLIARPPSSPGTSPQIAFTLPPGYRPSMVEIFYADMVGNVHCRVDVMVNGNVQFSWPGTMNHVTISDIQFSITP